MLAVVLIVAAALAGAEPTPAAPTHVRLSDFVGLDPERSRSDGSHAEIAVAKLLPRFYPSRAFESGIEGRALIECDVGAARNLANCTVLENSSAEWGFHEAAIRLSAWLKLKEDTAPPAATRVRLTLLWLVRSPEPVWKVQPTKADLDQAYPEAARAQKVPGAAMMNCFVTDQGVLTNCEAWLDEPPGLGFGAAAVNLAPKFVAEPRSAKGGKVRGKHARVTVSWDAQ